MSPLLSLKVRHNQHPEALCIIPGTLADRAACFGRALLPFSLAQNKYVRRLTQAGPAGANVMMWCCCSGRGMSRELGKCVQFSSGCAIIRPAYICHSFLLFSANVHAAVRLTSCHNCCLRYRIQFHIRWWVFTLPTTSPRTAGRSQRRLNTTTWWLEIDPINCIVQLYSFLDCSSAFL